MSRSFRYRIKVLAALLALAATIGLAAHLVRNVRITYRIAVPEMNETARRVLQDAARIMADEKSWVTLKRVAEPSFEDSAKALKDGKADLAIIRPDVAAAPNASTLAILRRDAIYLIVPSDSKIESFKDLRRTSIGVLASSLKADALLDQILDYYSVPRQQVTRVPVETGQIGTAIRDKKIAGVLVMAAPQAPEAVAAFAAVAKATRGTPDIIGVDEAEAIAKRIPGLSTEELPPGAFGGANPRPEEETTTLATTVQVVANRNISNIGASEIVRLLFLAKARLSPTTPAMQLIETPDAEDTSLELHPGAKAFYDGEPPGIMDSVDSFFWTGSALLSLLASLIAWMISRVRATEAGLGAADISEMVGFLSAVRKADFAELEALHERLEDFIARAVQGRADGALEPEDFNAISVAVTYARDAISDRRDFLKSGRVVAAREPEDA